MSNVISAIKSSVSELGLNNEQISQLTNRYQNLSNYDPSRLFEKTGHGIHLNTKALIEYENAFEAQEKAAMQSKLEGLVKKYKDLTDQINNTSNATERAKLFADRSDIAAQIEALTTLQSQYDALTSKYNKWQQAQSMGEEGDMYDNITGGLENINKLYKEGLIGTNKFKSALEMMTGMDTTGMSSADLIKAYEEAYPKMKRYFTEGMQGAKNFVKDLEKIGMATKNAEGGWDFAVDVEKAAEELGVSTDVIEAALRKLKDYNFDIDLSGYGSGIEAYATDIDTALSEIKKSKEELDKAFENGEINVQEYVDAMKVLDDYQKKLEEIQKGKTDTEMPEPVTLDEAIEQINTLQTAIDTMTQAGIEVPVTITGDKELLEKLVGSGDLDNKEAEVEYNANTDDVDNYDPEDKDASVDYNANTEDPDGYEPEDKEATADYNVDYEDVDNYTPEDKQAEVKLKTTSDNSGDSTPSTKTMEVKLTVDSSEVDGYTPPADKTAEVTFTTNSEAPDGYTPEDKNATVVYDTDTSAPDDYTPDDKEATVVYDVDDDAVKSYTPPDKSATVKYKPDFDACKNATPPTLKGKVKYSADMSGVNKAEGTVNGNGTAHARGTAFDRGRYALKNDVVALSGEVGPELVVRDGRFFTVGNDGAEFFRFKSGDIIFNASQTEELLRTGVVRSNNGRGLVIGDGSAYASGTAFVTATGSGAFPQTGGTGSGSHSGSGSHHHHSSGDSSGDSSKDKDPEWFDWIEIVIARIEAKIEALARKATSTFKTLTARLKASLKEIKVVQDEIDLQQKAYKRYLKQANSVKLSKDLKKKVRDGTIDITKYDDSTREKIEEYQEWYEKALKAKDKIDELKEDLAELYQDRFEAVEKAYENKVDSITHKITTLENKNDATDYTGGSKNFKDIRKQEKQKLSALNKEAEALQKKLDEAVASGTIKKGSEAWYEMQQAIDKVKEEAQETALAIKKSYKDAFDAVENTYKNKLSTIQHSLNTLNNQIEASAYTGEKKNYGAVRKQEKKNLNLLNKEADALRKKLAEAVASGEIKEGSDVWYQMVNAIAAVEEEAQQTALAIKKSYKDAFDAVENTYKNKLSTIQHSLNMLNKQIEASTYTGEPKDYAAVRKVEKQNYNMLNREAAALQKKLDEAVASGEIKEGSDVWFEMVGAINQVKEEAEDTAIAIAKSYKDAFDSIEARYSNTLNVFENASKALQNGLNMIEAKGYLGGASMYEQLKYVESQTIATRKNELKELEASLTKAVSSGKIKEGSDAWYEMRNAIDSTKLSIQESETQLVQYDKKIRQLKWDTFDYLQERIASISSEADFLIDLLENSELFDDNGAFTNAGNATLGLHAVNYDVYAEQVRQYTDALKDLDKEIADDPYDTELIKRREELLKLQRDSVLAIEQEKKAVVELVEEGIRIELDALRELIDKYNESVDSAKELYDYQKKVSQQSNTIANLQKQIAAYSGDTSDENRARLQRLRDEFENANEELQEMQYDKYISDQKRLLDDLYDEYEEILNRRLDDVDALMREIIDSSNNNSETIRATIESECGAVGITMTQAMDDIWSTGGKAGAVVTSMTNGVLEQISNVSSQLAGISEEVNKMVAAGEAVGGTVSDISKAAEDQIATMESILAQAKEAITSGDENTSKATTITSGISDQVSDVYSELELIGDAIEEIQAGGTPSDSGIDLGDLELDLSDSLLELDQTLGGLPELDLSDLDLSDLTIDLDLDDLTFDLDLSDLDIDLDYGGFSGGLVSNGFASGGFVAGAQRSAYRNGDDIVTFNTLKSGEAVLTPEQAAQFKKLVNHLPVLQKVMDVNSYARTLTPVSSAGNNIDMGGFNVTFQIDHVQDYNDLVRQMRDDKRFERMIQTMTVDPLVGKSTLAKKRFYN